MKATKVIPRQRKTWSLNERPFHFLLSDRGLAVETYLSLVGEDGEIDFRGAEHLAGMAANDPQSIQLDVKIGNSHRDVVWLCVDDTPVCRIGRVPSEVIFFLKEHVWNHLWTKGMIGVSKYDVFIAPAWRTVGTYALGDLADFIDEAPEIDVEFLIAELKQRFSEYVYHVQIGFSVPLEQKWGG